MKMLKNIIRALRLPFITASVLPFVFGSLINKTQFSGLKFGLGLSAVVSMHLFANLLNDYADSKSGADWQDKKFYGFFGGSKLIQEGVFSEKFYLGLAIFFAVISLSSVIALTILLNDLRTVFLFAIIIGLAFSYSAKPLQLSYHRLGELAVFLLCGPALVMGGYFIQTGIFPDLESFVLSIPFGMLVAMILFANEVPDYLGDIKAKKFNIVSIVKPKNAFIIYILMVLMIFSAIFYGVIFGYLSLVALFSFLLIIPMIEAMNILRGHYTDKSMLIKASQLTIMVHTLASIILILALIL